jgi:hypothetical protein
VFYGDLYGCGGENPQQPVNQLDDLVRARKLFAYGEQVDHWDHPNCLAWLRKGDEEHDGSVTVICNGKEDGSKKIEVGKEHAGEKWTDVLGWHQGEVTIGEGESHRCPSRGRSSWQMDGPSSSALRRVSPYGPRRMPGVEKSLRSEAEAECGALTRLDCGMGNF